MTDHHQRADTRRARRRRDQQDRRIARAAVRAHGPTYAAGRLGVQAEAARTTAETLRELGRNGDAHEHQADRLDRAARIVETSAACAVEACSRPAPGGGYCPDHHQTNTRLRDAAREERRRALAAEATLRRSPPGTRIDDGARRKSDDGEPWG